ncbi:MAG TPA: enoyl-CoA hydratase [Candidatus Dormibacteraeota bacterium]|nr:enoyl-CoA hydratase [Candidatus Dormibacteraeota bacterium]
MSVLLRERRGAVELLTLNRPEKRNALSSELLQALGSALRDVAADSGVRAVVITGADPAFCAGVDLGELSGGARPLDGDGAVVAMREVPQPTIAAVNGACVTGGLELALNCDIRIASERARFADTHARVGVHPGWGMTAILPRVVGAGRAKHMSLSGDYVDADAALRMGLISRLVEHASLIDTAVALAESIASADSSTLQAIKRIYDEDSALLAALARERAGFETARLMLDPAAIAGRVEGVKARGREQAGAS